MYHGISINILKSHCICCAWSGHLKVHLYLRLKQQRPYEEAQKSWVTPAGCHMLLQQVKLQESKTWGNKQVQEICLFDMRHSLTDLDEIIKKDILMWKGDTFEKFPLFFLFFMHTHNHQFEFLLSCHVLYFPMAALLNHALLSKGIAEYLCLSEPRRNHHYRDGGPCKVHLK